MAYRVGGDAVVDRINEDDQTAATAVRAPSAASQREEGNRTEQRRHPRLPRCPEIDCVRDLLPPAIIALAELRAAEIGVGADRVLVNSGYIEEETYVAALAASLDRPYEPLTETPRDKCPLADDDLLKAARTGLLPLSAGDGVQIVVTPRLVDSRRLVTVARSKNDIAWRIRLTTTRHLQAFVARHGMSAIRWQAIERLCARRPDLSAGNVLMRGWITGLLAAVIATSIWSAPAIALMVMEIALGTIFLAWTALRFLGVASERLVRRQPRYFADDWLPVYSVVVALYHEASAVEGLIAALRQLNYPAEKLDIKLVLEVDDKETADAIARLKPGPPFEIIFAPLEGPRTKPKALNAALPFVRGSFVVVYDAEDRPEPDQLRLALEAFVAGSEQLACVQARLTIDNCADSWLSRLFTAEYAGLFDVFLPGLSAWQLPLPLGGSSNHFRTWVLRQVGAWDPYNVTEDADLGMRLARFGYRTAVIPSTTYEEAPSRFAPWLRQRTRWIKGWMQTWLVHMRKPRRLAAELGLPGFLVFQLLVGGTAVAALVHLLFAAELGWTISQAILVGAHDLSFGFHAATLLAGYLVSIVIALIGLARRRLLDCAWALALMPLYWLLLSLAAWRALYQLASDPHRWEKTEHGHARTSRLAVGPPNGPPCCITDSASVQRPPLPAGA